MNNDVFINPIRKENTVKDKSYAFALRIVNLYKYLKTEYNDYVIGKQLLRCGTSIGANIKEGNQAQSHPDFISKMSIALKEASETEYWLELIRDSHYITEEHSKTILAECEELIKLLTAIIKKAKDNEEKRKQAAKNR